MAKRKAQKRTKPAKSARKGSASSRSAKRPIAKRAVKRQAPAKKKAPAGKARKKAAPKAAARKKAAPKLKAASRAKSAALPPAKVPRLDRARRTLVDEEPHGTPSSLDLDRRGSAVRTGRAESAQNVREHHGMNGVTGGDPDVDIED